MHNILLTSKSCLAGADWGTHLTVGGAVVTVGVAVILVTVVVMGFFNIGTLLLTAGCCTGTVTPAVVTLCWGRTCGTVWFWPDVCFGVKVCILTVGAVLFVPFVWDFTCLVKAAKSCADNTIVLESVEKNYKMTMY